ncbi:MAG: efflux RND transporter periplasmic adaptor subunit, partial [Burkholderiales bacterium]|nr:efflux RND transporter periplasmic adaptor subunit [Burkholderiales bacterium]
GSIVPGAQATVKAKVAGTVQEAAVQEGVAVQAGQILVRLDAADLAARVATQQASLDEAQARLSLAQKNNTNNQALLKQNYISQNAYDTTQNSLELAQASVRSAKAQLEIARIALADSVIRAPIAGVVSKRYVQSGDKASPDMPMYTIVSLKQMTLEAQVPASDIASVKIGQDVSFKVDGLSNRSFNGKVERINPNADAGSRALLVYVQIDNDGSLKGGMYAKGSIALQKSQPKPLLPVVALRSDKGKDIVYKIKDGKIVAQPVSLGLRNDDEGLVEVNDGLQAGDNVMLTQIDQIKPGTKVKLANKAPAVATAAANKG